MPHVAQHAFRLISDRQPIDEVRFGGTRAATDIVPAVGVELRGVETLLEQRAHDLVGEQAPCRDWCGGRRTTPRTKQLCEMTNERMASSLARPPALRITWASLSLRPAYWRIEPCVHAGQNREAASGGQRSFSLVAEISRIGLVGREHLFRTLVIARSLTWSEIEPRECRETAAMIQQRLARHALATAMINVVGGQVRSTAF